MEWKKLCGAIEAILFTMGEAVRIEELANAMGQDEQTIITLIDKLKEQYAKQERGIQLVVLEDAVQLCTKTEYYDVLTKLVNQPKKHVLTDVMLETLSIIAYRQPVTRQQIEEIRGVKCDHAVNKLIEYQLVCEVGRLEAPGRPILFGTTQEFLRCFGVQSVDELPIVDAVKMEDIKKEAIEEAELTLEV